VPEDEKAAPEREVGVPPHQPYRPDEIDETDEAGEESFPASDPPGFDGGSRERSAGTDD
jgi:hypothetical protein